MKFEALNTALLLRHYNANDYVIIIPNGLNILKMCTAGQASYNNLHGQAGKSVLYSKETAIEMVVLMYPIANAMYTLTGPFTHTKN